MPSRMPSDVLLDTSAWIAFFRGQPPDVADRVQALLREDRAITCSPVLFEIRRGLRSQELHRIQALLSALRHIAFTEVDWQAAAELDRTLRSGGLTLPLMDTFIAAVCLRHHFPLLTLDDHFRSVPGLTLV